MFSSFHCSQKIDSRWYKPNVQNDYDPQINSYYSCVWIEQNYEDGLKLKIITEIIGLGAKPLVLYSDGPISGRY